MFAKLLVVTVLLMLPSASSFNAFEPGATSSFVRSCCAGRHVRVGMYNDPFSPMWRFVGNVTPYQEVYPGEGMSTFFYLVHNASVDVFIIRVIFKTLSRYSLNEAYYRG